MQALRQEDSDRIIYFENISTVSLDTKRFRVVFNFMSPIKLVGRWTPDYHYFEYNSLEDAKLAYEKIIKIPHVKLNFYVSENPDNTDIVNKKAITSLSMKEDELKIIFNLNYSVTSFKESDGRQVEISKVIFWNYDNDTTFEGDRLEIEESLSEIHEI